jgi:DNA-binding winged helix-turn-helix (wHTH) protein
MSETRTHDWRELCLEAVSEPNPVRLMAIVVELGRILREDVHEFGSLRVDVGHRQVTQNGKPVCLTQLEFQLLRHLMERAGSPVSRDELLRSVWGYDSEAFTRTVDVHVGYLRQKLEQDAKHPKLIVTVRGVGYKLIALDAPESSTILANHAMRFQDWKHQKQRPLVAA